MILSDVKAVFQFPVKEVNPVGQRNSFHIIPVADIVRREPFIVRIDGDIFGVDQQSVGIGGGIEDAGIAFKVARRRNHVIIREDQNPARRKADRLIDRQTFPETVVRLPDVVKRITGLPSERFHHFVCAVR